ncbi:hypothetical protein N7474_003900 [Penicillium riverlandense]|uniref:uncharacterized protein n=1 Tax=Penicillium riverlandense TaxID=1903569 RepID=UPI0025491F23|nr:uncharacterized protein N7474_003900 [Penicillium riverlandense]KAJ5818309.1 hypothetical protein N7474_003900 [Penicillium riverlandense]
MGNSQSNPNNDESRRANRLSKPLTQKLNIDPSSTPHLHPPGNPPELATGLIGWQNPWVASHISHASSGTRTSYYPKPRDIPPTVFEAEDIPEIPELPERSKKNDKEPRDLAVFAQNFDQHPFGARPTYRSSPPFNRRDSYQPEATNVPSEPEPEQPRRPNSIQTPLPRHRSVIYDSKIEDVSSSNTHFLVDNQRFSLTRRRSLLTRPGVATRRTTSAIRRMPSTIGEPESPEEIEANVMQWPLPARQRPPLPIPPPARPTSPMDSRYTQLGALKLGSLRVVNGSSPCPSERIPLTRPYTTGPGLGLDHVETTDARGSALRIRPLADVKKADDTPGSPFSFEKSPTITVQSRSKTAFPGEHEDEGIAMCDEVKTSESANIPLEKTTTESSISQKTTQSLNKSDSGYSSAASIGSQQRSRTRESIDSQTSVSCGADSSKNVPVSNSQSPDRESRVQRRLSLQEVHARNSSRPQLASSSRDDPTRSMIEPANGLRGRRSTVCGPRSMEDRRPYNNASVFPNAPTGPTRGPLYGDWCPINPFEAGYGPGSSPPVPERHRHHQLPMNRSHRALSEHNHVHGETDAWDSRSRSRSSRTWSQKPGIDVPPLPTILSPGHGQFPEDMEIEVPESYRGRPRSRSHDYRRRKLMKARPSDLHMTTSPFVLH